jgi:hypothetical protein
VVLPGRRSNPERLLRPAQRDGTSGQQVPEQVRRFGGPSH